MNANDPLLVVQAPVGPPIAEIPSEWDVSSHLTTFDLRIDGRKYQLREMTGASHAAYLKAMKADKVNTNGEVQFKDPGVIYSSLLCVSMFDDSNRPVTVEFIRSLPHRLLEKLAKKVSEISGLFPAAKDEAKNE